MALAASRRAHIPLGGRGGIHANTNYCAADADVGAIGGMDCNSNRAAVIGRVPGDGILFGIIKVAGRGEPGVGQGAGPAAGSDLSGQVEGAAPLNRITDGHHSINSNDLHHYLHLNRIVDDHLHFFLASHEQPASQEEREASRR